MPAKLPAARISGAILAGALALSSAGCSLMAGDFAPRGTVGTTIVSTNPVAGVETKPAVLTDNGAVAGNVATVTPPRASSSIDNLPQLPKDDAAISPASKLTATEKARVIAELEALARGEIPAGAAAASATKPECAPAANAKPGVQTAALPASCNQAPKTATRP